jgi:hypothetical protein
MSSNRRALPKLALLAVGAAVLGAGAARAEVDLAALRVVPERGQSADQARRDRYECHNWAVEQSGEAPPAAPVADDAGRDRDREARADKVDRVITGAAIGGLLGGIVHGSSHRRHDSDGVLAGAAVGAAIGAATDGKDGKRRDRDSAAAPQSGYLRALSACLEGRGYSVALPQREDSKRR